MKLKRFLALAVSLAMVITMIPAFSLTASAAATTTVIDYLGGEVVWSAPDGEFYDTAVNEAFEGWTVENNGGNVNVRTYSVGNTIQYYTNGVALNNTITAPGYGDGAEKIILEWVHKTQIAPHGSGDLYFDFSFKDLNGTEIAFVQLDKNTSTVTGNYKMGYPVEGTGMAIVAYNNEDGSTHTVEYYVGGSLVNTESAVAGTINGFKSITATNGRWSTAWNHMGFANLTIATYTTPSGSDATTIKNALNKLTVDEVTKGEALALASTVTDALETTVDVVWTSSNEDVIANDGTVTPGADLAVVTLTPSVEFGGETVTGNAHEVAVFPAVYTSEDEFSALGASYNVGEKVDLSNVSWNTRKSTAESVYPVTGLTEETVNGVKVTTLPGLGGAGNLGDTTVNARTSIAVTPGQAYLLRFYYGGPELGAAAGNMYNKVYTTAAAYEDEVAVDYVSGNASASITTKANEWTEVEEIFVPSEGANFLTFVYSWQTAGLKIADMELYTLVEDTTAVETVASVADVAPVKVIGDTAVVLPATVKVTGSLGSEIDAPVVWDAPASYEVGTTPVNGVATIQFGEQESTTANVSTTVTVLEETFTLDGFTSVNGQDEGKAAQVAFPVAISDAFSMEFNANYASFGDLFITIKTADAGFFTPEQIALGVNAEAGFRPVNGNGSGGRAQADSTLATLTAGTNYRFFITTSAATDKYTVTVYDAATGVEIVTAENFGYRTNSEAIEVITALTNNGAGEVTLSNIKVNSTVTKTEFTFVVTKDGETTSTTGSFWTAAEAEASVVDYEDYHKEVTVDGTTVTVVYTNTKVVAEEIESIATPADITVFGNEAVVLPSTLSVTGSFGTVVDAPVVWTEPDDYVGTTTVSGKATVQFGEQEAEEVDVAVNVTVVDEFTIDDFTSVNGQTDGKNNQKVFPIAIRGAFTMQFTANYASFGDLFITIKTANAGFFGPEQIALGVNGTNAFRPVDGNGAGGRANADADQAILTAGVDYGFIITSDASTDKYSVVIYDKATGVVVAEVNDFGYRTNADAIEAITALTNNGAGEVTLTNIKVDTSVVELVTVTVDGVAKKVVGGSYSQALTGAVLVDADGNIYAPVNGVVTVPVAADMTLTTKALGLAMVGGAQVRIGSTELEDGAKIDALADSGLRFLATADYSDTLISDESVEFGIKVTAEGSDKETYVPAVTFQNDDNTVFSAAITNLAESNYNRNFTAVAYAKVGDVIITTDDPVTRSIYQVSAGIMKNGSADAENAAYTVDGVVKNILNAYVNQTGIRLSYTADGIAVEEGKYTGDVFFTVTSVSDGDDGFNVTIAPDTTWGTPAEIAQWWTDYVRFNNNNSIAKTYISNEAVDADGVLTFNFDTTADDGGFEGDEDPLV